MLWTQSFETFIAAYRKLKHLTASLLDAKDATYEDWYADDAAIVSWLVNNMEPIVARGAMMLCSAKKIRDTLRLTYGHEKNILRVLEVYEQLFTLRQGDHLVQKHFTLLCVLLDEFDVYQPDETVL